MGQPIKFTYGTVAQIEALTDEDPKWVEQAFYYPDDATWFYQIRNGEMKKYHGDPGEVGVGCKLNGQVMGGVKQYIEADDLLVVPLYYEYNTTSLTVDGTINLEGSINIL